MAIDWTGMACTDEDVAALAEADWLLLVQSAQHLAAGRDGAVDAGDPWVLSSASNDFAAQGVAPGCVVVLDGLDDAVAPYARAAFGVVSTSSGSVTLRLVGVPEGSGMPPGGLGSIADARFRCATLYSKIQAATRALARDAALSDADLVALVGTAGLIEAAASKVLCWLYYDRARVVNEEESAQWSGKARSFCARYKELADELKGVGSEGTAAEEESLGAATMGLPQDTLDDNIWHEPPPVRVARRGGGGSW